MLLHPWLPHCHPASLLKKPQVTPALSDLPHWLPADLTSTVLSTTPPRVHSLSSTRPCHLAFGPSWQWEATSRAVLPTPREAAAQGCRPSLPHRRRKKVKIIMILEWRFSILKTLFYGQHFFLLRKQVVTYFFFFMFIVKAVLTAVKGSYYLSSRKRWRLLFVLNALS